ncbi:hypothetical protein HMP0721_1636 [Pseudoramibacter alactolyticus ATCC 23263]|uniref:Uncharacterized protein n=1 Tax=Pseudoramibacter alactolyticus ATCC 23263 TaxID=887929 RepID=E6MIA3_9FIRM|nr:hypothetical protein HMP0721_1636 [Pseudoramibacter alactolyticus ATCC 23263]
MLCYHETSLWQRCKATKKSGIRKITFRFPDCIVSDSQSMLHRIG